MRATSTTRDLVVLAACLVVIALSLVPAGQPRIEGVVRTLVGTVAFVIEPIVLAVLDPLLH